MLDFRTCKFSELLNLYININKVSNKTPKQARYLRTIKHYLHERFPYHFTLYIYAGEIVADDTRDSDLHNRALTAYVLQGAKKIGRYKVCVDYDRAIGERCRYVSEYGIQAVTDEQIDFDKVIDRIYH